jgi:hypothetical protein
MCFTLLISIYSNRCHVVWLTGFVVIFVPFINSILHMFEFRHEWNLNLQQTNRFLHQSILEISDIFLSGMQQNEGKLCRIAHISKETHVHKWHKITWIMYRIDKWHKYHKKHISIYGLTWYNWNIVESGVKHHSHNPNDNGKRFYINL